ncbi:MAG TPA: bifunctional transaldolase/phosoglucose isomerase [Candidatus Dormibacteraeota bacterium]|nr:bifunctional transaldolase/phosoglucose isomerase [Candidatus Dormibacteraeota bacterium]
MKNQLEQLLDAGQSVWLDNLRRSMFASGELAHLIERGLRGMTSNPTIFEKAIGTGDDYDAQLRSLIDREKDPDALFWDLAVQDIQSACDAFGGVYSSSKGNDGFVSLEVSPLLAHDTQGTIAMAKQLWNRVDRPNLMVKIPGTNEGVEAIETCIYEGLNINVTLIFSIEMYEKTARAYIKGLERRIREGKPVDTIRSVNSVFVSRIDTAVDRLLDAKIAKGETGYGALLGKTGIANLKLTYQKFKELFQGETFAKAAAAGAHPQRPLWASTSTKNPSYSDLMYVDTVIGPDTVNTMPPNTLAALLDHGTIVPNTIENDLDGARATLKALQDAGISLFEVTHQLQIEGVASFSDSFAALLGAITYKQNQLASGGERIAMHLGDTQAHYEAALTQLANGGFLKKLWAKDPSPWTDDAAAGEIVKHSLGWLDIAQRLMESVPNLRSLSDDIKQAFDSVVVMGMGGSSLAPDVLHDTLGDFDGYPRMFVLDSTDPQQIAELEERIDVAQTLFVIASKSGTTTEPNAFYAYFHDKVVKAVGAANAGSHFVAITDPGTVTVDEAKANNFAACFENDPNIGGRYSALSFVGIVPSALAGYDIKLLLDRGLGAMHANEPIVDPKMAPGVRFGAAIGGLAVNGRDKLTIVTHPDVAAFGAWAEQLIAESTGKLGKGIIPIAGEELGRPDVYGSDRLFVYVGANLPDPHPGTAEALTELESAGHPVIRLALNDEYDLGEQFYLWEIAVAAAGSILRINAFDQPNVQESKDNTKALLAQYLQTGSIDEPTTDVEAPAFDITLLSGSKGITTAGATATLSAVLSSLRAGDYEAICAYVARNERHETLLDELRLKIRDARRVATTVGFGPRFLHSTGQLHKGGPDTAVMLQITADEPNDPMIPGMNVGFRTLLAAQALGDWQSLDKRHRRGMRVHLKGNIEDALRALIASVDSALTATA